MPPKAKVDAATTPDARFLFREGSGSQMSELTSFIEQYLYDSANTRQAAQAVYLFSKCSDATGGYVQLRPEYKYIPVLVGNDGQPVPLFHVVEVLDEFTDYSQIHNEMPTLSYAQINGAVAFLRKLAQQNPHDIDIDKIEDEVLAHDEVFLEELRSAFADSETTRVLNFSERDR
jgi:hypothetical protein